MKNGTMDRPSGQLKPLKQIKPFYLTAEAGGLYGLTL